MTNKIFPFVDDEFDDSAPPETPLTSDNDRFPLHPPKPNLKADSWSKSAQKLAERIVEATNRGRPPGQHISQADVEPGLLRAFEASDASLSKNVSNLSSGTLKPLSSDAGELLYVDVQLSPIALVHDPANGRTVLDSRSRRRPHLGATDEHASHPFPIVDVPSTLVLRQMVAESAADVGFSGATIKSGQDFNQLSSVGLQGVHEPLLVLPVQYRDEEGNTMWTLTIYDGNRRAAMARRVLQETTGLLDLQAWDEHLDGPEGPLPLRDLDATAANAVRRTAAYNDHAGGTWSPTSGRADDIEDWLSGPAKKSVAIRSARRCSALPVRLVVGFNTTSLSDDIADEPSRAFALTQRIVRRLHINEASQKEWDPEVQAMQVAITALKRAVDLAARGDALMPLSVDELNDVVDNKIQHWFGSEDGNTHPLRLTVKTIAALVCNDHDMTDVTRTSLKQFQMSVSSKKVREVRSKVAASFVMPMLGFGDRNAAQFGRVRTVLDRAFRSKIFYDTASHPSSETQFWWELLDLGLVDLQDRAMVELAKLDLESTSKWDHARLGPASRALLGLAVVAMAASPAVAANTGARSTTSDYQLTQSGMGGDRGNTSASPEMVLVRLCFSRGGITQLTEIVRAGLEADLPKNVMDPEAMLELVDGKPRPDTRGLLTEDFLRGEQLGFVKGHPGEAPKERLVSKEERFTQVLSRVISAIKQAHEESRVLLDKERDQADADGETLADLFKMTGISDPSVLKTMLNELQDFVNRGEIYADG